MYLDCDTAARRFTSTARSVGESGGVEGDAEHCYRNLMHQQLSAV